MKAMICIVANVTGKVQRVFYRASTREQANRLGLAGYAKNMPDGSVEVLAYGDRDQVDKLRVWLEQGPPQSEVEQVRVSIVDQVPSSGFRVL